jgi:hypothetical protein
MPQRPAGGVPIDPVAAHTKSKISDSQTPRCRTNSHPRQWTIQRIWSQRCGWASSTTQRKTRLNMQGVVMGQGVEFMVWLGIPGLALFYADVHLWHTRRTLRRLRRDGGAPGSRLISVTLDESASAP